MSDPFPEDVRRFLLAHINSVEQLEVLLLLRGAPDQVWTATAVGQALYTSAAAAVKRLTDLAAGGLVTVLPGDDPGYRFSPADDSRRDMVDRLAEAYSQRRVAVISLIYSKPNDQVQAFSDAFRLRKDE